jgi:hypothetical protein
MKKKHLFIIIGQSVAIFFLVVFAFVQQTLAKEQERLAMAARIEAETQRAVAIAEAMRQRALAEEAMKRKR